MKTKTFKLTEEQFILLTANCTRLMILLNFEKDKSESDFVKDFYQKDIDKINKLLQDVFNQY